MLKSPYPYFGGKSRIAHVIWQRLGDVRNFVDPFFGSGAVLLGRPDYDSTRNIETVNDLDGMVTNFWRAVQADAQAVAKYADWPVNENDLHARHAWLVNQKERLQAALEGDPVYYNAQIAGWWVWGMALWIGSGFCSGDGAWHQIDGQLVHLADAGQGIQRQLVHLINAGRGIQRQLVHLGNAGRGESGLYEWFDQLQTRFKRVRVASGDWARVVTPSVTFSHGLTGVVLDPPYTHHDREVVYSHDDANVAKDVREWAITNGSNPLLRIAYCGYDEPGIEFPSDWECYQWRAKKGYGGQSDGNENRERERIWFSPHCVKHAIIFKQAGLFDFTGGESRG